MRDGFYWVLDRYYVHPDAGYPEIALLRSGTWFFATGNRTLDNSPDCLVVISPRLEEPSAYR